MPTTQDLQKTALDTQGFTGTIDDQMKQWAEDNGATADQLQDAVAEALIANGSTAGNINDMWLERLTALGYTGTMSDMLYQFWKAGGNPFINGATFDGTNDYLLRGGDLTGNADSKVGLFSAKLRLNGGDGVTQYVTTSEGATFRLIRAGANDFRFIAANSIGTTIFEMRALGPYTASSDYIEIIARWDLSAGEAELYINDVSDISIVTLTNDTIDYVVPDYTIGSLTGGASKLNGDINFLYFDNANIGGLLSVEANRRKFFTSEGGSVLNPNGNGSVDGNQPIMYFAGDFTTWHQNKGTGGGMTVTGALSRPPL